MLGQGRWRHAEILVILLLSARVRMYVVFMYVRMYVRMSVQIY